MKIFVKVFLLALILAGTGFALYRIAGLSDRETVYDAASDDGAYHQVEDIGQFLENEESEFTQTADEARMDAVIDDEPDSPELFSEEEAQYDESKPVKESDDQQPDETPEHITADDRITAAKALSILRALRGNDAQD